jgi:hypothetical protein
MAQPKRHVHAREGKPFDEAHDMRQLRRDRPHELAARRHIEEQIANFDAGARRMCRGFHGLHGTAIDEYLSRCIGVDRPRHDPHPRDGPDGRQRLTAEAERHDRLEIIERRNLAGGMALHREGELACRHAAAIIAHADQRAAALFDVDLDARCPGIETVLDQFLDHRRRALDDLAGRDLVDQFTGEESDGHDVRWPRARALLDDSLACGGANDAPGRRRRQGRFCAVGGAAARRSAAKREPSGGYSWK